MVPIFRCVAPAPALREYVDRYWFLDAPTALGDVERYLPGLALTWIFGRGSCGRFELRGTSCDQPRAFVKGILRGPCIVRAGGATRNFGVAFRPGAAAIFHRLPLGVLDDQLVDIDGLGDPELRALSHRIAAMDAIEGAAAECDAFLLGRLAASRPSGLGAQLVAVVESGAVQDVRVLAERAGFSARQLRRIFHREIGATPKAMVRILRMRAAAAMVRGSEESLTEVALRHGYFDQAHFVRDFRSLVGVTPGAYRRQRRALAALFE